MSDPKPKVGVSTSGLQVFAVILLSIVGLGAFILSFKALMESFEMAGNDPNTSFIFPIIIDGPILAATVAIFYLAGFERKYGSKIYSWFVLILFSAGSIVLNASHAADNPDRITDITVATVMAAAPPVALMLTIHLLAILVHRQKKRAGSSATAKSVNAQGEVELGKKGKTDAQLIAMAKRHLDSGKVVENKDFQKWMGADTAQAGAYHWRRIVKANPEIFGAYPSVVAKFGIPATGGNKPALTAVPADSDQQAS